MQRYHCQYPMSALRRSDFFKTPNFTNSTSPTIAGPHAASIGRSARRCVRCAGPESRRALQRARRLPAGLGRFCSSTKPVAAGTARLQCCDDVRGLEGGHARADDHDRAFQRHGADARQAFFAGRNSAGGFLVDDDGTNGAAVAYGLVAANGAARGGNGKEARRTDVTATAFYPRKSADPELSHLNLTAKLRRRESVDAV